VTEPLDGEPTVVNPDVGLSRVMRRSLFAGIGAWVLAIALVVASATLGSTEETPTIDTGDGDVITTTLPIDGLLDEGTTSTIPETTTTVIPIPKDFTDAGLGINPCGTQDCVKTLIATIDPPVANLADAAGQVAFTINFSNTAKADEAGNGTGYFITKVIIGDNAFTVVENQSTCPTATGQHALPASQSFSCTLTLQAVGDFEYSNNPRTVSLGATLVMLPEDWTSGDPASYPTSIRSAMVAVPQ